VNTGAPKAKVVPAPLVPPVVLISDLFYIGFETVSTGRYSFHYFICKMLLTTLGRSSYSQLDFIL
jgi:hypothetical protein